MFCIVHPVFCAHRIYAYWHVRTHTKPTKVQKKSHKCKFCGTFFTNRSIVRNGYYKSQPFASRIFVIVLHGFIGLWLVDNDPTFALLWWYVGFASRAHRVILSSDSRTFKLTEKDPYQEYPRPYKDDCACKCNNIK